MNYTKSLLQIEAFVHSLYLDHPSPLLYFHTYARVKETIKAAEKIVKHYQLSEELHFIICAATWFHDTGYLFGEYARFRIKSAQIAEDFLNSAGIAGSIISEIKNGINATAAIDTPSSITAQIICDAQTYYYGTDSFKASQKLLKKEVESRTNVTIRNNDWRAQKIKTLETHRFYTDYCQLHLQKTKEEHIDRLKKKYQYNLDESAQLPAVIDAPGTTGKPENKHKTAKATSPDKTPNRGIETMFRISSSNSQKISAMADNKAHIMISVNSIIISVVLGLILGKLDENRHLILPTLILLIINVTTIIFSILATRPKLSEGVFTPEEVENKSVDLMFYGNFYNMELEDYQSAMKKVMNDREFLYGSLVSDIYWQGKVLARKYRLLRISYNIFMYGIAIAVIVYAIAAFLAV